MDLPFYRRSSARICLSKSDTLTSIVAHLTAAKPGCLEHFPGFVLTNFTPIVTRYLKESWNASRDWPLGSALGACAPVRVNTESVPAFKALQQHHRGIVSRASPLGQLSVSSMAQGLMHVRCEPGPHFHAHRIAGEEEAQQARNIDRASRQ